MKVRKAARIIFLGLLHILILLPKSWCSGVFELQLKSFKNDQGVNIYGNCCNGIRTQNQCSSPCRTFFHICLANYFETIPEDISCNFASLTTQVLGNNTIIFSENEDFQNPIQFPFEFSWPGDFTIIIESWHDSTMQGPALNSLREPISRLAERRATVAGDDWLHFTFLTQYSELSYSYRVICDENYYGPACSVQCRGRDDTFGHYTCTENGTKVCLDGWKGDYCTVAICNSGCHPDHGYCDKPFECKCRLGWDDVNCSTCIPYPGCKHGTCEKEWECNCLEGWGGLFCNQDLNYCTHHTPCKNNGTCQNTGQGAYTCHCPPGFLGTDCERDITDCNNQPCQNGGTCTLSGSQYVCRCPTGYTGKKCDTVAESCEKHPCRNGATCVEGLGSYSCICKPGYTGHNCETEEYECESNPCKHGGKCIDEVNGFRCVCAVGFSGQTCEENIDNCKPINPCQNEGICIDKDNDFHCQCKPGFVGPLCQTNVDDCRMFPCANGGVCYDLVNDYRCECKPGFTGKDCSDLIDECEDEPCLNGGQCTDLLADYKCMCINGYHGKNCQYPRGYSPEITTMQSSTQKTGDVHNVANSTGEKWHVPHDHEEEITMTQLLLIVCLGVGIPLLLIIIVVTILLCRKRTTLRESSTEEEKQNQQNSMNNKNKFRESNIFTTNPTIPQSSSTVSNLKLTNEEQDYNTNSLKHSSSKSSNNRPISQIYLEKSNNKQFNNIPGLQEHISPPPRDFEKPTKKLDHLSIDSSHFDGRERYSPDIHIIHKPINREEINRNSLLILEQQSHRHSSNSSYYSGEYGEDVLATEV